MYLIIEIRNKQLISIRQKTIKAGITKIAF